MLKKIIIFIVVFVSLIPMIFEGFPSYSRPILVVFGIAVIYFLNKKKKNIILEKSFVIFFFLLFLLQIHIMIVTFINGSYNYNTYGIFIRVILYSSVSYFIADIIYRFNKTKKDLIEIGGEYISYSYLLHSVIVYLQFFSVGFRNFIFKWFNTGKMESLEVAQNYRMTGLVGGEAGLTVSHSIGALISYYLFLKTDKKRFLITYLLITFSNLFIARTGLYISIIIPVFFVSLANKRTIRLASKLFLVYIVISVSLICLLQIGVLESRAIERGFEMFIHLFEKGEFYTTSTNDLFQNHYQIWPTKWNHFLFGTGYVESAKIMGDHTDVGFSRFMFFSGILGVILVSSFYIYLPFHVKKYYNNFLIWRLFLGMTIIWILANAKIYYFLGGGFFVVQWILIFLLLKSKSNKFNLR